MDGIDDPRQPELRGITLNAFDHIFDTIQDSGAASGSDYMVCTCNHGSVWRVQLTTCHHLRLCAAGNSNLQGKLPLCVQLAHCEFTEVSALKVFGVFKR
jgi:hypothetical protein